LPLIPFGNGLPYLASWLFLSVVSEMFEQNGFEANKSLADGGSE
jgi:hypothetical protein